MSRDGVRISVLCSVELVGVMGSTLVLTMLPSILAATGSSGPVAASAVSTAYAVGYGGFLVLGARVAAVYGHVLSIVVASVAFAIAGIALVATSSVWLVAASRLAQGVAAAVLVPAALALIVATVPDGPRRRRAMAAWGGASAAGGAIGFLVGSMAAAITWWQSAFLLQTGLSLILACLVAVLFRGAAIAAGDVESMDLPGGFLVTTTLGLAVAGTSLVTSRPLTAGVVLAGATTAAAGALWVERRAPSPILQLSTLRKPPVRVGSLASFLNTATTSSAATLLTLSLQSEGHANAAITGLTMLPFSLAVIAGSMCAPPLMASHGDSRTSAVGLLSIAAGTALLPLAGIGLWGAALGLALSGCGIGLSAAAATHLGTRSAGDDQAPAAAVLNTAAQLGTSLGVAASLAFAELTGPSPVWWALAAIAVLGAGWTARGRT